MKEGIILSSVRRLLSWSRANSLWYFYINGGCCADEWFEAESAKYDIERFGLKRAPGPASADLLVINGTITQKMAPEVLAIYDQMQTPKYVLAIGTCACSGGPFLRTNPSVVTDGAARVVSVDVYVPGCPPRPEAIMNGIINLQEKICGKQSIHKDY